MAVTTLSSSGTKKFVGLSSDTKPTTDVPVGSEFYESDTGLRRLYSGTDWFVVAEGNVAPEPYGDEVITVSTSAVGLTAAEYAPPGEEPATEAIVAVIGQPVMLRDTGTEVTTTEGVPLAAGAVWVVEGATAISQVRLVRTGGSDATVYVRYARPAS